MFAVCMEHEKHMYVVMMRHMPASYGCDLAAVAMHSACLEGVPQVRDQQPGSGTSSSGCMMASRHREVIMAGNGNIFSPHVCRCFNAQQPAEMSLQASLGAYHPYLLHQSTQIPGFAI